MSRQPQQGQGQGMPGSPVPGPAYSYSAAGGVGDDDVEDPYPEDDAPTIFDPAQPAEPQHYQRDYDEADIAAEEYAQQQYDEAEYQQVAEGDAQGFVAQGQDFSYLPAPQVPHPQQPQRQQQQQRRQQPVQRPQPPQQLAAQRGTRLPAAPSAAAAAAAPARRQPAAQAQARRPVAGAQQRQQMLADEDNPFLDPPSQVQAAPRAAAPAKKRVQPPATAGGAPHAASSHATAAPSASAAPAPSGAPLPAQQALSGKMEHMLRHNMSALEKGSERVLASIRGLEDPDQPARQTVDDEQLASHNYDLWEDHVNQLALDADSKGSSRHTWTLTFLQLLLTIAVAFLTAAAMYFIHLIVHATSEFRVETTLELIGEGKPYGAYFALLSISLLLAAIGTVLVTFLAPNAKGGGVPYVQAYLNGTNVASYFSFRIVIVKIVALAFTIASGLSLGMEGPFVFIGAGIAIILNKSLELLSFGHRIGGRYARILKNINEERVFMAGGIAAGLAVAFNAPIAGVLMALEGSTAFLTVPVVLRVFGCAMFATFFNDIATAGFEENIHTHNLITITAPRGDAVVNYSWVVWEIAPFALLAAMGGVLGATAIWINVKVTRWRHHHVEPHPPHNKLNTGFAVGEVLAIVFLTATAWFVLPYVFGCREMHEQCFPTIAIPMRCQPVQCPSNFYSEIGTLIYSSPDTVARILFDRSLLPENDLAPGPLIIWAGIYMCFTAVAYGSHVPGGLFVPSVVVGGCMGRVVGWFVRAYVSSSVNPGVYALLGAASMFGGFTRIALPAVVMLTEMTGDATYLLPIMFCTVLANVVSGLFQPPLYPQHMAIEGIPTLGDKLNPLIAPLQAKHIMQKNFHAIAQLETLGRVLEVLDKSRSMLIPVVSADGEGKFMGMVMRRSVIYALKYTQLYKDHAEFLSSTAGMEGGDDLSLPAVMGGAGPNQRKANSSMLEVEKKMGDHRATRKHAGDLEDKFDDKFASYLVNITPFMDAGALTAHEETSAKRIAAVFRRLGISHLGVSDGTNKLVGVITRRHLIKPPAAPPSAPNLSPQRNVEQILAADDLEASPEAVLELAQYDAAQAWEASAMGHAMKNQGRAAAAAAQRRRGGGVLAVENAPAVRFDDDEDAMPLEEDVAAEPLGGYDHAQGGDDHAHMYDDDEELARSGGQSRAFKESSLSRLKSYTQQLA